MTISEMRAKRVQLVNEARAIYDKAEQEKRSPTAEDRQAFDRIMAQVDELKGDIDRLEQEERVRKELGESQGRKTAPETRTEGRKTGRDSEEYRAAFGNFLRNGVHGLSAEEMRTLSTELRSVSADVDIQAGYMIPPSEQVRELIKFKDNFVFIRQLATKYEVPNAVSLGAVSWDTDPDDATWTSELATGNESTGEAVGRREFFPRPVAKRIKATNKLLRALPGFESWLMKRLAYKFGITEEKAFLTGNGAYQPLGLFTASNNGIDTSRDVTCASTTTFKPDDLITTKYKLKVQYQQSKTLRWVFHRDTVAIIRKFKDGNGQYLWAPGIAGDPQGDTILGIPYVQSEYAPNTFTTGLYVGLLGDMAYYWIADALGMTVQRLVELYAETNQVGFIGRQEVDGMPVLAEAFVRMKLA